MTVRAIPWIVALSLLASCGSGGDTTAPRPSDATVAHLINREAAALGLAHIGTELWLVSAIHFSATGNGSPSTSVQFERQDWSTGTLLENVQVPIPDGDFIVGGRTKDWSLHTTLSGHGDVSLTFHPGQWQNVRFPVDTFPGGTIIRVAGKVAIANNQTGLEGSIFGQPVTTDLRFDNLILTDDAVVERTP